MAVTVKLGSSESITAATGTAGKTDGSEHAASQVFYQLSGTWVGTITFQASLDGTNWQSILAYPTTSTTGAVTATSNGIYRIDASGVITRCYCSAFTSGTIVVATRP